ncbi:MAG: hypothetical protein KKC68_08605 [Candidatus Thermoplasmatota archaeon]|nr:hypothetical protein [Candidatus Thermoplasmatota archaeon]
MKKHMTTLLSIIILIGMLTPITIARTVPSEPVEFSDYDPLVDINVTVTIITIRSLEKVDRQIPTIEKIDAYSDPDFYVKIFINDVEFTSDVWKNTRYIYDPQFSATLNVPDDEEFVDIKIQLLDWNLGLDKLCDISTAFYDQGFLDAYDVELSYSIKSGHWFGDDENDVLGWGIDPSGYGRLNGCDDGSIYQRDYDCELWFDISQNDYDNDGIPYWSETHNHNTDPMIDDTGTDADNDSIPIEWEDKWGHFMYYDWHSQTYQHYWEYSDLEWNDHANLDPDQDALTNLEEYWTSEWGSDPFRKDVFLELDQMQGNGEITIQPYSEESKEILFTAFDRQNKVIHIDDGNMGGGEFIPFAQDTTYDDLQEIYRDYFLHNNESTWRRGVFHYGLMIYNSVDVAGAAFGSNRFYITYRGHEKKANAILLERNTVFASALMHELGHTFDFWPIGGHDRDSFYPWQPSWWKWRPYKSCMNYGYMYSSVDYSDGSRGKNDFDDWSRMDFYSFQANWG